MKNYHQSPLPFQGQKRNFLKAFKNSLNEYSDKYVFVDLFGGSGLLSHAVKCKFPKAKVVYNDFDNFKQRVSNIKTTNAILDELRELLAYYPRSKRILGDKRKQVFDVLQKHNNAGYVDWITLSASLLFSMNYGLSIAYFQKQTLYNRIRKNNYSLADDYLQGVDVVCSDYSKLFENYKNAENVVFLIDPPYLSTDTSTYTSKDYWKLKDYLNVLKVLENQNYFYFTSNKSQITELCEWVSTLSSTQNPFANAECFKMSASTTHNTGYTDIMYHYKKSE